MCVMPAERKAWQGNERRQIHGVLGVSSSDGRQSLQDDLPSPEGGEGSTRKDRQRSVMNGQRCNFAPIPCNDDLGVHLVLFHRINFP